VESSFLSHSLDLFLRLSITLFHLKSLALFLTSSENALEGSLPLVFIYKDLFPVGVSYKSHLTIEVLMSVFFPPLLKECFPCSQVCFLFLREDAPGNRSLSLNPIWPRKRSPESFFLRKNFLCSFAFFGMKISRPTTVVSI